MNASQLENSVIDVVVLEARSFGALLRLVATFTSEARPRGEYARESQLGASLVVQSD